MSGRAGRRGIDERGIVMFMVDEKMDSTVGRELLKVHVNTYHLPSLLSPLIFHPFSLHPSHTPTGPTRSTEQCLSPDLQHGLKPAEG